MEYDAKRLALVLAVQSEIEGMKALNIARVSEDKSLAYDEAAFIDKADELRNLAYAHEEQL